MRTTELSPSPPRRYPAVLLPVVWLAGLAVVLLVVALAGNVYALLGDSDPGAVTAFGFGVVRFAADVAGVVCGGSLVFAAFVAPGRRGGFLTAEAFSAVRLAAWAASGWVAAAVLAVPFSAADASGLPVRRMLEPGVLLSTVDAAEEPKAWLCVLVAAIIVSLLCWFTLSWRTTVLGVVVAMAGLLPPVVAGHASVGGWHDFATNAMLWHIPAASAWAGSLVALLAYLRRVKEPDAVILRRYQRLSLVCFLVVGISGAVAGLILARPAGLASGYGLLLGIDLVVLAILGVPIMALRRRNGSRWRVLIIELLLLAVALGTSVGLTHLVPPSFLNNPATVQETVLGYNLDNPPSFAGLVFGWRFDLLFGFVALIAIGAYLLGVRRLRRRGDAWAPRRTIAWCAGWLVVLIATSSGLGPYASGTFSMHMIIHMTLNMLAPVLLVLGGPLTLALRALPAAGRDAAPGPREWLVSLLHSRAARIIGHPALASVVFVGSFYALYFTDLFGQAMLYHWAHQLMNLHFLVAGYVFFWLVVGVDRPPRPLPHLARLGMLFAVMPFHAFFGVILMNKQVVIAETFYRYLSLPWAGDLLTDQQLGGGIAWATGEIPMVVVVVALLAQWARADEREAKRIDRTGEDDFAAYNAMLAELAAKRR
ncbi:cytochrome c oxidase assembly protein [Amycolatopsis sp. NPDC058986]|uniref:cytochrome c oxidase assembly protein n=1 Tax=unclassified Amycolatopsis TaxID=2618356 RepID=UPI0036722A12